MKSGGAAGASTRDINTNGGRDEAVNLLRHVACQHVEIISFLVNDWLRCLLTFRFD